MKNGIENPNDFAGHPQVDVPSFEAWLNEPGCLILEALQPILERRWLEIERTKGQVGDWSQLHQQGLVQGRLLQAFTQAVDGAGRRDLVRFLMNGISRLLSSPDMDATFWIGGLQGTGPTRLADRLETQRNALAVLRTTERFRGWEREARQSGYLDDDYAVSQFWLGEWERFDFGTIADRAEWVMKQLEPLRMG